MRAPVSMGKGQNKNKNKWLLWFNISTDIHQNHFSTFNFLPVSIPEINKQNIMTEAESKVAWIGILLMSLILPTTGKIFVPYGLPSVKL